MAAYSPRHVSGVGENSRKKQVMIPYDQGSQYTSYDWQTFLKTHALQDSISRRGNCHDNTVAESFFQVLKRKRVKRKICSTQDDTRIAVFYFIEIFYNSKKKTWFQ